MRIDISNDIYMGNDDIQCNIQMGIAFGPSSRASRPRSGGLGIEQELSPGAFALDYTSPTGRFQNVFASSGSPDTFFAATEAMQHNLEAAVTASPFEPVDLNKQAPTANPSKPVDHAQSCENPAPTANPSPRAWGAKGQRAHRPANKSTVLSAAGLIDLSPATTEDVQVPAESASGDVSQSQLGKRKTRDACLAKLATIEEESDNEESEPARATRAKKRRESDWVPPNNLKRKNRSAAAAAEAEMVGENQEEDIASRRSVRAKKQHSPSEDLPSNGQQKKTTRANRSKRIATTTRKPRAAPQPAASAATATTVPAAAAEVSSPPAEQVPAAPAMPAVTVPKKTTRAKAAPKKTAKAPAIKKTAATSDAAAQRAMNSNPTKSDITSVHKHYLAAMPSHLLAQEKAVMDLTKPFAPAGNLYVVGPKTMEASLRHPAQKAALEERLTWVLAAMEAAGSSMGRGKKKNTEQRIPGSIEFFTDLSMRYLRDRLKSRIRIEVAAMK